MVVVLVGSAEYLGNSCGPDQEFMRLLYIYRLCAGMCMCGAPDLWLRYPKVSE